MSGDETVGIVVDVLYQYTVPRLPWRGQADVAQPDPRHVADHQIAAGGGGAHSAQFQKGCQELGIAGCRHLPRRWRCWCVIGDSAAGLCQPHVRHWIDGLHTAAISRGGAAQIDRALLAVIRPDRQRARVDGEPARLDGIGCDQIDETLRLAATVEHCDQRAYRVNTYLFGDETIVVDAVLRGEPPEFVVEAVTARCLRCIGEVPVCAIGAPRYSPRVRP